MYNANMKDVTNMLITIFFMFDTYYILHVAANFLSLANWNLSTISRLVAWKYIVVKYVNINFLFFLFEIVLAVFEVVEVSYGLYRNILAQKPPSKAT